MGAAQARMTRAYQLYLAGLNFHEIAASPHPDKPGKPLYANPDTARTAVKTMMARNAAADHSIAELREMDAAKYERVARALWSKALTGDPAAVDRWLRTMSARADVLGLKQRPAPPSEERPNDDGLDELTAKREARLAGRRAASAD